MERRCHRSVEHKVLDKCVAMCFNMQKRNGENRMNETAEERAIMCILDQMTEAYNTARRPYLDRLVAIRELRVSPPPMLVSKAQIDHASWLMGRIE